MVNTEIKSSSLSDFMRMNDERYFHNGAVYVAPGGNLVHELENGYSLTYEGDGIVRVKFDGLESRAYDDHAFYAQGYAAIWLPCRFLELYKHEISVGHVQREDEK